MACDNRPSVLARASMIPLAVFALLLPVAVEAAEAAPTATARASRTLGELALADGRLAFAPCDGEAALARGVGAGAEAAAMLAGLNGGADGSAFVDADAVRDPDGEWRIERLRRAYRRGPRCSEDLGEFVWRGTLPASGWTFNASRRYVALRRPGERPLFFRYRPFEHGPDGAWRFSAQAEGARVEIVLRAERCRSADGSSISDWSLQVALDGRQETGCAWGGEPR